MTGATVTGAISRKAFRRVVYLVLVPATVGLFKAVPGGFVCGQDNSA